MTPWNYLSRWALALAIALAVTGCDRDHDHETPTAGKTDAHDEHDEHDDHGHDGHADEVKLSAEAIKRAGIVVQPAGKHVLKPTFIAPGRVTFNADATAHVGAVLRGRVTDLKVKVGDTVAKGAELLIVESPELGEAQSDYIQKRTAAITAKPAVDLAKDAYDRAKTLYDESRGIALTELQKREAEHRAAQGALTAAESAATAAENKLHLLGMDQQAVTELARTSEIRPRYAVRAPIAGQITQREVTLGELVNPDKEAMLVITDLSNLWAIADVPEARLKDVAVGSRADVKVPAATREAIVGKVSYIEASLDPATRSARVRIVIQPGRTAIRPGMFAQVEIHTEDGAAEAVLAVPEQAVQTVEGSPAVFVPVTGEENTFAKRAVRVGSPVGGMVPILTGLKEGDGVVTQGSFILKAELGKGEAGHDH